LTLKQTTVECLDSKNTNGGKKMSSVRRVLGVLGTKAKEAGATVKEVGNNAGTKVKKTSGKVADAAVSVKDSAVEKLNSNKSDDYASLNPSYRP
jgi:hypothetical protein